MTTTPSVRTDGASTAAIPPLRAHYLWLDLELPQDDRIDFVSNLASSPITPSETWAVRLEPQENSTVVHLGPTSVTVSGRRAVGEAIYGALHDRVLEFSRDEGWVRLHLALLEIDGRRVALAGNSGSGKTTTTLALAQRGALVHGDEVVFARDGATVALPRPLHLKVGTVPFVRDVSSALLRRLEYEPPVFVLDPARAGWAAESNTIAPIDLLVLLNGSFDDHPHHEPASIARAMDLIMPDAAAFNPDHSALVRQVVSVLGSVPIVEVTPGTPSATAELIESLARA